jgi:2-polyprenyl-3-methyl-5-hydroxy-6-metoxy-1,4-benzoquinol methylase
MPHSQDHVGWEAVAAFWHDRMGEGNDLVELLIWPAVQKLLPPLVDSRVLDVGCGNGLYARKLASHGATVFAIDYSAQMIEHAKGATHDARIEYAVLDAADPVGLGRLPTGSFDAIMSTMVLMDMSDVRPLFEVLPRLLRKRGVFVFATAHPCFNSPHASLEVGAGERGEVRIRSYQTSSRTPGVAIRGQPAETLHFHRSFSELLRPAFQAGLVLDALEEPSFPADHSNGATPGSWGGRYTEFPSVLVGRLRVPDADGDQKLASRARPRPGPR